MATRGSSPARRKHTNLGIHSGWSLAFARYSDSICHHRDASSSTRCHSRSAGPAPTRAPRSNTDRKTAKFSEIRQTPSWGAGPHDAGDDELEGAVLAVAGAAHEVERQTVRPHADDEQVQRWKNRGAKTAADAKISWRRRLRSHPARPRVRLSPPRRPQHLELHDPPGLELNDARRRPRATPNNATR
jgi:hypothetical protein